MRKIEGRRGYSRALGRRSVSRMGKSWSTSRVGWKGDITRGVISELKGYWEDRELSEGREDKESHREIELENNLRLLYLFLCGSIQSGKTLFFL